MYNAEHMDLQEKIKRKKLTTSKRLKEHYALARSLGFTALEAGSLSQLSKNNIIKHAVGIGKAVDPVDVTSE
jgi:hypothetical protein